MKRTKSASRMLCIAFGLIIFSMPCFAEIKSTEKEDAQKSAPIDKKLSKKISVDFVGTEIDDVLRMISQYADVDMVKSPDVTGTVNARLSDVPVGEALENILAVHNYAYVKTNTMLRIVPESEVINAPEKTVSKVYRITYADAVNVASALKDYISETGRVSVSPGTSNIAVTDKESRIKAIDEFIEELDRVTEQVIVEVRIYDVSGDSSVELGIEWNAGTETSNSIGQQVHQTTGNGIDYSDEILSGEAPEGTPIQTGEDPFAAGSFDKESGGSIRLGFLNDSISVDMILSMLHKEGLAKLLANPKILVLDNETANFEIVREIPYKEESETSQGGSMTSTEFKDVGVKLEVTPHITRDDMLRLRIIPEFGIVENQSPDQQGVPTVNTRRLDTIALLKSGETVVLGGLKRFETTKNYTKAPILGDIPLIAPAFRSENETVKESELMVFIRPLIIPGEHKMSKQEKNILEKTECPQPNFNGRNLKELVRKSKEKGNEDN
ncbi:Type IV pilus biogenesis and competence protein PilQ precursor [Sedimentisphaera cyanobacteriorum]|uniref:Type IV pilus biogenesis and competence protein PilQ n=1 Tax=Sedimentisphaera cyanobacteriorum TaxID=1940790 RepID=A0A1Q2HMG1_9BACT|nr:secretin N-terminal domain-containing protein [Sedimentisphaera cyanobacteriorum]AQQ08657.1 Type IV pilus biogenesis and competence protein PilQ precursor [Sedimentisphaera cyanobacteriorum]